MSKWIVSLGLALLITACATPQQQSAQTAPGQQSQMVVSRGTQPSGQKLICTDTYPMGSHIPQRICVTPAEAAARQKASQQAMQNIQMQGNQNGSSTNPP